MTHHPGMSVPREREVVSPVFARPILRDARQSALLRMRSEQVANSDPHGEEPRSGVSNHEAPEKLFDN